MKRRDFVRTSAYATVVSPAVRIAGAGYFERSLLPGCRTPALGQAQDPGAVITLRDDRVKALALSAVEAARSAGARYADVRLTNTMTRQIRAGDGASQTVVVGLSVRALVNGYWGWVATPTLSTDEAVRVARLATHFASVTATHGQPRTIDLGTIPVVPNGDWTTPVKIDPFGLDLLELHKWFMGIAAHLQDLADARHTTPSHVWDAKEANRTRPTSGAIFTKQERLFASTEGSVLTQTVITTNPSVSVDYGGIPGGLWIPEFNTPVQAGWERLSETPLVKRVQHLLDKFDASPPTPPSKALEIGRYDVVFSASAVARLLGQSLIPALELDRALGYEANAGGTSYFGPDPLAHLGKPIVSPLVTIDADRSSPLSMATVKWDDDGVAPTDFPVITKGALQNYPTTREQAPWLASWAAKRGRPVHSLGCAMAPDALSQPMQHTPNLTMRPGAGTVDEETLIKDLEHGLLIGIRNTMPQWGAVNLQMDWQCLDGYAYPVVATEIRRGQRVGRTWLGFGNGVIAPQSGLIFKTSDFWKNIEAIGGAASAITIGDVVSTKGDPAQRTPYTISAVPVRAKQLAIIDGRRKA